MKNMIICKKDSRIDNNDYIIIHDIEDAYENCFENDFIYEENEGFMWNDILEDNMGKVWGEVFKEPNYKELTKIINDVRIPNILFGVEDLDSDICSEVRYELDLCAKAKLVCGRQNTFFEELFSVYKAGGWPCGWKEGKFVVYIP